MDLKAMNSMGIFQKRETHLAVEDPDSVNEWKTVRLNKSETIKVIIGLLRRNLKKRKKE